MMTNPRVKAWLNILGLEVHETKQLFHLLDDSGDGQITADEFMKGITRLKGHSRAMDVIAIQHELDRVSKEISSIKLMLRAPVSRVASMSSLQESFVDLTVQK